MPDVKTALVDELPDCDMCKVEGRTEPAEYDARIRATGGRWGNLCQRHFDQFRCRLGLGMGQKLVVRSSVKHSAEILSKVDDLCRRCGKDCPDNCWNKETGRHRILNEPEKIEVMISLGLYCEEI